MFSDFVRKKGVTEEYFKSYNNIPNNLLRKSKVECSAFNFKETEGNPGKTWRLIKSVKKKQISLLWVK